MSLDQIQSDLAAAQKARDEVKVSCLRFLLGAAFNLAIAKGKEYVLTHTDVLSVIAKQVKTHQESIAMFSQGNRPDLVDREKAQLVILQTYLPPQLSKEELKVLLEKLRNSSPGSDFGSLMKLAMEQLKGKADGATVARVLKEILG